jgi:hypothetical protein
MRKLKDDSGGFAFSLDLLLALIPLTILLGMVAVNMGNILYLSENTIYQSSLQRVGSDAADALVETSGTPPDWEKNGTLSVPGLARYDPMKNLSVKNYLAPLKIFAMNDTELQSLVGPGYGLYLNISISNGTPVKTWGTYNSSAANIVRIERIVLTSKLELVTSLEGAIRATGQPRVYTTTFPTDQHYLQSYEYWILVDNHGYKNASIDINSNIVVNTSEINQNVTTVRKIINPSFLFNNTTLINNVVTVRAQSDPGANMNVYVVAAFPGTPASDITLDNVQLRTSKLILYIWTR